MKNQDPETNEILKRRISEYALAEDRGVQLLIQMQEFVPEDARAFLESQIKDELKHNRLFEERAVELNMTEPFFLESLKELYDLGQDCVDQKDWLLCMVMQCMIEELALASFGNSAAQADPRTREILKEIMDDEFKHLEFTADEIQKYNQSPADSGKIYDLQKRVLQLFISALMPERLDRDVPKKEQQADYKKSLLQTYRLHCARFKKLKIKVPGLPELLSLSN